MTNKTIKLFLVAGESSGDALGSKLMRALKLQSKEKIEFFGVGGPLMINEGMKSLFPMEELSLMGLIEILPHIRQLKKRVLQTADAANQIKPDAIITIDSPGFAHAFIKRVTIETKKIHYVAPSVWAWKPKRVFKFKKNYDHILALLPFEPPYFEKVNLPCHFVGHSILESGADLGDGEYFRNTFNIDSTKKLLMLLPGSRKGEVTRLLPIFRKTIERLKEGKHNIEIVIPAVEHLKEFIQTEVNDWGFPVHLIESKNHKQKYDAMNASDLALAASGTVALETAMAKLPTVIAYRISPITYKLIRRIVKVRFAHLINILADKMIIPEFIQNDCTAEKIEIEINKLLNQNYANKQLEELTFYLDQLKPNENEKPSEAAASQILNILAQ